jgi:hypothetical protein
VSRNCELKLEGPQCGMIRGRAALRPAVPGPLELPALPLLRLLVVPVTAAAIRVAPGPGALELPAKGGRNPSLRLTPESGSSCGGFARARGRAGSESAVGWRLMRRWHVGEPLSWPHEAINGALSKKKRPGGPPLVGASEATQAGSALAPLAVQAQRGRATGSLAGPVSDPEPYLGSPAADAPPGY